MNKIQFLSIILISLGINTFGQEDSLTIVGNEPIIDTITVKNDSIVKTNVKRNFFIGVDLYQPILTAFTDKTAGQVFINTRIKDKWHAVAEVGYERNTFDDLGWNVDVDGLFFRVGFNYFLTKKPDEPDNGFYTGLRFAFSPYTQTINQYTLRSTDIDGNPVSTVINPNTEESVSAYWVEPLAGARVKLFDTNFYADVSARLQIPVGDSNSIDPLVVPGFGKDEGGVNANLLWGISYRF